MNVAYAGWVSAAGRRQQNQDCVLAAGMLSVGDVITTNGPRNAFPLAVPGFGSPTRTLRFIAGGIGISGHEDQPARFCPDVHQCVHQHFCRAVFQAGLSDVKQRHTVKTHGLRLKRGCHFHFLLRRTPVANGA